MDAFTRILQAVTGRVDKLEASTPGVVEGVVEATSPLKIRLAAGVTVEGVESLEPALAVGDAVRMISYGGFQQGSRLLVVGKVSSITGPAMLSGSNANGDWARFPAIGLQICRIRTTRTDVPIASAYGPLFTGTWRWTFPQPFLTAPTVTCSEFLHGTSASWGSVATVWWDAADLRGIDAFTRAAGTAVSISAIAIGKYV